jgi:cellulose biosynthesis protein BcsQ
VHHRGVGGRKGGVGKTQTALTLALLAALVGYRVLLVDADEQQCPRVSGWNAPASSCPLT